MLVPKLFYGKTATVKRECKKIARKIKSVISLDPLLQNIEFIDTTSTDGLIVLDGPSPTLGYNNHFHVYIWLWMLGDLYDIGESIPNKLKKETLDLCIHEDWALLGVLTSVNASWIHNKRSTLWTSILSFFPAYEQEGKRFSTGGESYKLWEIPTSINSIMIEMGVPKSEFQQKNNLFFNGLDLPPFWHLVEKYNLPTDFPPYIPTIQ